MFSRKHRFKTPIVLHAELGLQSCLICNKGFRARESWEIHVWNHTVASWLYLHPLYYGFLMETYLGPYAKSCRGKAGYACSSGDGNFSTSSIHTQPFPDSHMGLKRKTFHLDFVTSLSLGLVPCNIFNANTLERSKCLLLMRPNVTSQKLVEDTLVKTRCSEVKCLRDMWREI